MQARFFTLSLTVLLAAATPLLALQGIKPGAEVQKEADEPEALKGILPPFTVEPFSAPPAGEGWGPVRLSPTGKFFLVERLAGARRSVHLLDQDGALFRGFASVQCPWAIARWGPTDDVFYMECRAAAGARPRYNRIERSSEKETTSSVPGLAAWAINGADYYLPVSPPPKAAEAGRFQRYTSRRVKTGAPIATHEPAWSPDGKLLAFLSSRPRPEGVDEAEYPPVREVRVIPARGQVPRVVLSRPGWTRLMQERGWKWASGPESVAWSPNGDALYGVITARTGSEEQRLLLRMALNSPKRETQLVDNTTRIATTSADGRHWLLEMDTGYHRLTFTKK